MSSVLVYSLIGAAVAAAGLAALLRLQRHAGAARPAAAHKTTVRMVRSAVIAAIYVVLCLVLAPISYGAVQVRAAEMLCLLPVFGPEYIAGVTLGCFLANLLGVSMGTTVAVDVVFGTLATLLACVCTWLLRRVRLRGLALVPSLPPVVFNAVIIGLEISFFFSSGAATLPVVLFNMLTVGIGEVISCCILGVLLVRLIESQPRLRALFVKE